MALAVLKTLRLPNYTLHACVYRVSARAREGREMSAATRSGLARETASSSMVLLVVRRLLGIGDEF